MKKLKESFVASEPGTAMTASHTEMRLSVRSSRGENATSKKTVIARGGMRMDQRER